MVKQFLGRNGIRNDRTLPNSSFDIVGSESVHFTIFTTTGRVPRGILSPFMGKLAIRDQTTKERNALSKKEFPRSIEKKKKTRRNLNRPNVYGFGLLTASFSLERDWDFIIVLLYLKNFS